MLNAKHKQRNKVKILSECKVMQANETNSMHLTDESMWLFRLFAHSHLLSYRHFGWVQYVECRYMYTHKIHRVINIVTFVALKPKKKKRLKKKPVYIVHSSSVLRMKKIKKWRERRVEMMGRKGVYTLHEKND